MRFVAQTQLSGVGRGSVRMEPDVHPADEQCFHGSPDPQQWQVILACSGLRSAYDEGAKKLRYSACGGCFQEDEPRGCRSWLRGESVRMNTCVEWWTEIIPVMYDCASA